MTSSETLWTNECPIIVSVQKQLASIMEALAKEAVIAIGKVVTDSSTVLRLEVSRFRSENNVLKRKLQNLESEMRTAQDHGQKRQEGKESSFNYCSFEKKMGSDVRSPEKGKKPISRLQEVPGKELSVKIRRLRDNPKEASTKLQSFHSQGTEEDLEVLVIKDENQEEEVWRRDPDRGADVAAPEPEAQNAYESVTLRGSGTKQSAVTPRGTGAPHQPHLEYKTEPKPNAGPCGAEAECRSALERAPSEEEVPGDEGMDLSDCLVYEIDGKSGEIMYTLFDSDTEPEEPTSSFTAEYIAPTLAETQHDPGEDFSHVAERTTLFSSVAELYSLAGEHGCPFCVVPSAASVDHLRRRHLNYAVRIADGDAEKFIIPCFCGAGEDYYRSHWHCHKCGSSRGRKHRFMSHLLSHGYTFQNGKTNNEPHSLKRRGEEECGPGYSSSWSWSDDPTSLQFSHCSDHEGNNSFHSG